MPALTIRDIPEEVHRALKRRAADHGHSPEAEVRLLIEQAVLPVAEADSVGLGSKLRAIGQKFGGIDLAIERGGDAPRPATFE